MKIRLEPISFPMHCGSLLCLASAQWEATADGDDTVVAAVCSDHKTPEDAAAILGLTL